LIRWVLVSRRGRRGGLNAEFAEETPFAEFAQGKQRALRRGEAEDGRKTRAAALFA
jgi:hypothetical protein